MDELVGQVLAEVPDTVVVNQSGTPVTMPWVSTAQTLLQAFYGGDELGNGLADIIFGKVNPSGKLALTFPSVSLFYLICENNIDPMTGNDWRTIRPTEISVLKAHPTGRFPTVKLVIHYIYLSALHNV